MKHIASLFILMSTLWLLLSGHFDPWFLGLGLGSVFLCLFLAWRMDVIDQESHPVELTFALLAYWCWLAVEVVKANFDVAAKILRKRIEVDPVVVRVQTGQRTDLGRAIFANSITLTPGTVSLQVQEDVIVVHALTSAAARDLQSGEMTRRVPDPGQAK